MGLGKEEVAAGTYLDVPCAGCVGDGDLAAAEIAGQKYDPMVSVVLGP